MDPTLTVATESVDPNDSVGASFAALPAGTLVAGRYEIAAFLGRGGYATVYRARDRELRRDIALKVLRPEKLSPTTLARLRREVNIARDAQSDHLVRVFDLGNDGATVFITMELVNGESLRQRMTREGPLAPGEAAGIAAQMLAGLGTLHARNTIHRDVKPENVLIAADGTVKLADFGLARGLDDEPLSRATRDGGVVGTADYVSPEQVLGKPLDARSDLYAAGIVLFEMIAGELPFARESSLGSMIARLRVDPRNLRSFRREAPFWLATVLTRLLDRDPSRRYRTAAEARAALEGHRLDVRAVATRKRVVLAALTLSLAAAAGVWRLREPPLEFVRLVRGEPGVVAVARDGRTLWRRGDVESNVTDAYSLARLEGHRRPLLATVMWSARDFATVGRLSFLDPDTGKMVRQATMPLDFASFPRDPRKFAPAMVNAVDVDGDGFDEIFISYTHVPEAPSFLVLYEPRSDRARVLFSAVGQHHFAAVHDVDGDGRAEVLLEGVNNGFDWINALVALRLEPWIGEAVPDVANAQSPDMDSTPQSDANLVWYTLLPRFYPIGNPTSAISFDDRARTITLAVPDRKLVLGMDGFLLSDRSSMPSAARNGARRAAYASYRESQRLMVVGAAAEALAELDRAIAGAARINEPILVEVLTRARGAMLIRSGRGDEGEGVMESLWQQSENRSEVAYDAAVAFQLHGDVDRAVRWYERGLGRGASVVAGKSKHEFIQGLVFALSEQGRWREAEEAMDRFAAAYPTYPVTVYRQFVVWRREGKPDTRGIRTEWNATDLIRYWTSEFALASGADARLLLPVVEREIAVNAQPEPLWSSLHAELLWRTGRTGDAAAEARAAWTTTHLELSRSIIVRGHLDVIRERFERIGGGKS